MALEPLRPPPALVLLPDHEQMTVALFLSSLANRNTREAYGRDIAAFGAWLDLIADGRDWSLLDANAEAAANWVRWMLETGASTATVARRQAALSKLYRWGSRPGRFHEGRPNPFGPDMIDRTKASSRPAAALTSHQVAALMAAAKAGPWPERDWIIVALMATTAIRVSELCAASHRDIVTTPAGLELALVGKGGKVRQVAIAPQLAAAMGIGERAADEPLVWANGGGRINRHQVTWILNRLARAASIDRLTPHMLRATQITESLAAGESLWAVQDNAGHSDPRTTRAYQRRAQSGAARQAMATSLMARYVDAE